MQWPLYVFFFACFQSGVKNSASVNSDDQFMCGSSKLFSKCECGQETDRFQHIPLFNIDCSRLDFLECPSDSTLPRLIGHLDLSHNKISFLNESVSFSRWSLYSLDFSFNRIEIISDKFFQNLTRLQFLNLEFNQLRNLTPNTFFGLKKLEVLNLQGNQLTVLPIDVFKFSQQLKTLTLSYNNLGPFLQSTSLLYYLPEKTLGLNLDHVGLVNISKSMFQNLHHITHLSLAYNQIQELQYLPLKDLESLDISGTNLSNITTKTLTFTNLKVLKLNDLPYLRKISDYSFYTLRKLEELYIEHCVRLEEIDPLAFGYLEARNSSKHLHLRKISLVYNQLKYISDVFEFVFEDLEEVDLRGNPWHCDCKLSWFKYLKKNVRDIEEIRCKTPETLANKKITGLTNKEFPCMENRKQKQAMPSNQIPITKWLFPVVGVLSIIVFVLIGFLIYMGPYDKKHPKFFGPESPYSQITVQPNSAEFIDG